MSLFQNVVVINERKFVYPTGQKHDDGFMT